MMPLDVTHKVLTHQRRIERFAGLGNETGRQVANMLSFLERFDEEKYGTDGGRCTILHHCLAAGTRSVLRAALQCRH